ncbi:MAG: hypothetical protein CMH76_05620 [Nitrospinae bacterium]|nr:hypothetical protein [Nitrospinota bacterium]
MPPVWISTSFDMLARDAHEINRRTGNLPFRTRLSNVIPGSAARDSTPPHRSQTMEPVKVYTRHG